jgi:DNA-binding MarR family transcriptional regulator
MLAVSKDQRRSADSPPDSFDDLARALYSVTAMRRDLQRLAGLEHAITGLTALAAVQRLGPVRLSDVAGELHVNLSVASRQVHALEEEGLISRVPDPSDGRSSLVELSPQGADKLDRVHHHMKDTLRTALPGWDATALQSLADGLVRLRVDLAAAALGHGNDSPDASPADPPPAAAPRGRIQENLR